MSETGVPNAAKYGQIVQAAVTEFQENGFAAASMDRVSARAGVSKRTVYKYFESKERLFQSIVQKLWSHFTEGIDVTYDRGRPVREQLAALAWAEGRLLMSPEVMGLARLVISELMQRPELAGEMRDQLEMKAAFVTFMREAAADGALAIEDPADATEEFLALIKAKAFWPVIFGDPIVGENDMTRIVDSSVEMMMCRYASG